MDGLRNMATLIVVLFVLLIIVGPSVSGGYGY
ncbi:YjcZ family sporulation protein [Neobacillus kokaensis]